ncbi:hypothetical protein D3Z38_06015 [Clostridiales bacterium]|nr:hypothetical protein [Clostridiales bacterium]
MLLAEIPQHLGEDKGEILWYNKRYRLKRRCRKEAFVESRPRIIFLEEGRGIINAIVSKWRCSKEASISAGRWNEGGRDRRMLVYVCK